MLPPSLRPFVVQSLPAQPLATTQKVMQLKPYSVQPLGLAAVVSVTHWGCLAVLPAWSYSSLL